ncbi:RTA1 like protein-domain-containing protein [Thelonectria olida]|uniref:RTA1 like protein-domain-containing protein n=1 Tax=Thelonectria olida TaxID=1576542 RepID=A0A9P8W2K9_9HYPO|nr:RTA1 like protein-domain-containing protein [Thelonectria olida]
MPSSLQMDQLVQSFSLETLAQRESSASAFSLYHYNPSKVGAVVFALLFVATSCMHIWQSWRTRCWFVIPLIIGGLFEFVGYGGRIASANESPDWTLGPYIVQSLLLLVAPALFAATIYMELGRLIVAIEGESRALIPKKWMTKIFVSGDVLSFLLQGSGGGLQSSGSLEALDTGANIIIVGLFVQLAFFGIFLVVAVAFHLKIRRQPTNRSLGGMPWQKHIRILYIASAMIMVRSVFRVVEYLQGFDGYLLHHEIYLYIFDALLMFLTMVLLNVVHPSGVIAVKNGGRIPSNISMWDLTAPQPSDRDAYSTLNGESARRSVAV